MTRNGGGRQVEAANVESSGPGTITISQSNRAVKRSSLGGRCSFLYVCTRFLFASEGRGRFPEYFDQNLTWLPAVFSVWCRQRLTRQCLGQTLFLSSLSHWAPNTIASENTFWLWPSSSEFVLFEPSLKELHPKRTGSPQNIKHA